MTLKEIAAELSVSPSIVSRVLNGYSRNFSISDELRARILAKVEECGYVPNPVFRSMRKRQDRQISLMCRDMYLLRSGETISEAVTGMQPVLDAHNYAFNYTFMPGSSEEPYKLPFWKMAGLFLPDIVRSEYLAHIEQAQIPYVVVNGICGGGGDAVQSDEFYNMRLVMDHLFGIGHRRIAYFNYPPCVRHYSMVDRERAFCQYCKEYALPLLDGWEENELPIPLRLRKALEQKATAIVTFNETMALELLHEAWRSGIRVPEMLSVICFNDKPELEFSIPGLTSIAVPGREMGEKAAQLLIARLENRHQFGGNISRIPGKLMIRESTAMLRVTPKNDIDRKG